MSGKPEQMGYEQYLELGKAKPGKRNKYNAVKTMVGDISFDSKAEATRWVDLGHLVKAGEIADLKRQVTYSLDVNGVHIADYRADFTYVLVATGETIVEDVKGVKTEVFRLKEKLMLACHGIRIMITVDMRTRRTKRGSKR